MSTWFVGFYNCEGTWCHATVEADDAEGARAAVGAAADETVQVISVEQELADAKPSPT